jgi:hypothetical protein
MGRDMGEWSMEPEGSGGGNVGEVDEPLGEMVDEVGTVAESVVAGDPAALEEI